VQTLLWPENYCRYSLCDDDDDDDDDDDGDRQCVVIARDYVLRITSV